MIANIGLGAKHLGGGRCSFEVWAPRASSMHVDLVGPRQREVAMDRTERGYWHTIVDDLQPGARYLYRIDDQLQRPDPASRYQPGGVHQASQVVQPHFAWEDQAWFGIPLRDYILYELHVGTFTQEGTFDAIIPHLEELKNLGITALELMPVAQFPGTRNWGYDGVCLFAVQHSYGGPDGLKRLVNACHRTGLAVVLDVVYNHLGPEGNYLRDFGPYFSDAYATLWGAALNFDGPHSDEVRRFFIENALLWQTEFHLDALRLDAVHAIRDFSAVPFLQELARTTRRQSEKVNRRFHLIAESDLNDARVILPEPLGGYGLDAQWCDDFHHCLHVLLTGEQTGYYEDFGGTRQLGKVFCEGYAFTGQHSRHRQRRHGNSPHLLSSRQLVVYSQNHDQIGNRLLGDRLSRLVSFESLKLGAAAVLLSPFVPMLFMGEEYGEPAPFNYVTSHTDPDLIEAVREGRRREFAHFHGGAHAVDPQAESTFLQSKLNRELALKNKQHRLLYEYHRELIRLRKELPALAEADKPALQVRSWEQPPVLLVRYWTPGGQVMLLLCFADQPLSLSCEIPPGNWRVLLDSAAPQWGGQGSPLPGEISTQGQIQLSLAPISAAVLQHVQTRV